MYAVAGVTGHTGSLVARALLDRGESVRAIVRNREHIYKWRDRGAEVMVADLNDVPALAMALDRVKGAYLLSPQSVYDDRPLEKWARQNESIVAAVQKAQLKNTVLLSSIGAHQKRSPGLVRGLYDAEQKFKDAKVPVTALRPAYFYENWIAALNAVHEKDQLPTYLDPDRSIPMVSVEDVARTAVELLLNPADSSRVVELSGPREYSPKDILNILEQNLNRKLALYHYPEKEWRKLWDKEGVDPEMIELLTETYDGLNHQKITFSGNNVESRQGTVAMEEILGKWVLE